MFVVRFFLKVPASQSYSEIYISSWISLFYVTQSAHSSSIKKFCVNNMKRGS